MTIDENIFIYQEVSVYSKQIHHTLFTLQVTSTKKRGKRFKHQERELLFRLSPQKIQKPYQLQLAKFFNLLLLRWLPSLEQKRTTLSAYCTTCN